MCVRVLENVEGVVPVGAAGELADLPSVTSPAAATLDYRQIHVCQDCAPEPTKLSRAHNAVHCPAPTAPQQLCSY